MKPTSVRNLLLSLGLATGIAGSADGCSSHSTSTPDGTGGSQNIGGAGGSQNLGGFCGNCMGQNAAGAGGHLDAATESAAEAGGDAPPTGPPDAQAGDAETGGG
jgi:hypothetical protein